MKRLRADLTILLLALGLSAQQTAQAQLVSRFQKDDTGCGQFALELARRALDAYCLRRDRLTPPTDLPLLLRSRGGIFVSAMDSRGAPRCCMGTLYPRAGNLAADLIAAATMAAAHDLRFKPLKPSELAGLRVIVSILDPPEPIVDPYRLDPVTDGLAVRGATRTGVVLPGETGRLDRFVQWGRIRAGTGAGENVEYFRIKAIRFMEPAPAVHVKGDVS